MVCDEEERNLVNDNTADQVRQFLMLASVLLQRAATMDTDKMRQQLQLLSEMLTNLCLIADSDNAELLASTWQGINKTTAATDAALLLDDARRTNQN